MSYLLIRDDVQSILASFLTAYVIFHINNDASRDILHDNIDDASRDILHDNIADFAKSKFQFILLEAAAIWLGLSHASFLPS